MSEVIGRRMPLKKHGREFQGLCPFHNEKTPSFTVNDTKGFYHCFGCGAHGDAIEFLRKFERLSYAESIELLAREAGIPLPKPDAEEQRKAEAEKTLYDALEAACKWFEQQLTSASGTIARDYVEKRGLRQETVRQFRVGYAPEERTALYQHLLKAGFSQALQAEAGLIIVPEDGPPYDRFRGRIMFPIRNPSGKVIAFGGRLIANQSTNKALPKYLNSPETPLFRKGEVLFNLDQAKKSAREGSVAVVMEGYMDVVSSVQSGITYALATLGTAVTPEHLRLLWQLVKEPVMCLDGDAAGLRAMMRAAEVALPLLKPGYSLRFAILPKGEDPDTYVLKHGKASFEKVLIGSRRLSQMLWDALSPQYRADLPEGRASLENALKQLTDKIADPTVKAHYASYFRNRLWNKVPSTGKTLEPVRSEGVKRLALQDEVNQFETAADGMMTQLLSFPMLLQTSQVEETLSRLDVRSPYLNNLRNALLAAAHSPEKILENKDRFIAFIKSQMQGELKEKPLKVPYSESLSTNDAMTLWNERLAVYQIAHLEYEFKELQQTVGMTMAEEDFKRLNELQVALKKAKAIRTFAPAETDIA